ncbi:CopG family transcriptional regulator [bacterium]|nr:CopG family transcriptional regulator [bacterium]
MNSTITLRIPKAMKDELEAVSKEQGIASSDIVRESLRRLLNVYKFKTLRSKILPYAERKGIFSDEDVLNYPS